MSATVICPSCNFENSGSSLNCKKCNANLIGIPRKMSPLLKSQIEAQQKAQNEIQLNTPEYAKVESVGQALWRSFQGTLVLFLPVAFLTALVCYVGNWRTLSDFGNGLIYAGVLFVIIGWYIFRGNVDLASHQINPFNPMNDQISGTPSARTRRHWSEYMDGINATALIGFLAALCIGSGWLIVSIVN